MPSLRIEIDGQVVAARLTDLAVRLGSDPACDLRIQAPGVSLVHLAIEPLPGGGHKLVDLNSGRPTRVNGLVVSRVALAPGDLIEVGPARITYLADVAPAAPAAPGPARPATRPAGVAGASRARAPTPGASARRLRNALLVVGAVAVATLGLGYVLRHRGDPESEVRLLRAQLDEAKARAATDVDAALLAFDDLARSSVEGIRREAAREAEFLRKRLEGAARDVADLEGRAPRLDAAEASEAWAALEAKYGASVLGRHEPARARFVAARAQWLGERVAEAQTLARERAQAGRFDEALLAWDALLGQAPASSEVRAAADEGKAQVDAQAGEALRGLVEAAEGLSQREGPRRAAERLRAERTPFAGTSAAFLLLARLTAYEEAARAAETPLPPLPTSGGTTPTPAPATTPTPATPSLPPETLARLEGLLAHADALAAAKRFADALLALAEAEGLAAASPHTARVASRRHDFEEARAGLLRLGQAIREHPERFTAFEITRAFHASLVDADEAFLTAAVRGGRAKIRWSAFDAERLRALVEAAAIPLPEALPIATLLRATGGPAAAEPLLVRILGAGGDAAGVHLRWSRWLDETAPAGGYVVYEGRLLTPTERDRRALASRIAAAAGKVGAASARERKAACEELLALGEPARPALLAALRARRGAAVQEIAALEVFTSKRTRQRLLEELQKRRAEAFVLILDEQRYPYPYPEGAEHPGQREVDALVERVREVWERPLDLVAGWEPAVETAQGLLTEVDEVLARAEEGYVPDPAALQTAVARAVNVPGLVAEPLDAEVLAYNERVPTTATEAERENVRLVNAYRLMMGRVALKLDERLVRAARGHSREMYDRGYFAHESPTPGLESPGRRAQREGYGSGVGENIAQGPASARAAFDGWYRSSGHHRNMLNRGWTEMGTGKYGTLWTQVFGGMTGRVIRDLDPLPPPTPDTLPEPADGPPPREGG